MQERNDVLSKYQRARKIVVLTPEKRSLSLVDWEQQSELLSRWNDELCSGGALPEVEIISLLEEQIPKYKLRADTITKFGGYENQDWFIPSPALQIDEADLKLSPDQIRETLNYFLLCSNRVSQMTKTYDDIEAVTRLLEEKEKDLELTARIGKELLQTNNKLETTIITLEGDLKNALEKITQLNHECQKKTELIQILTSDMEESLLDSGVVSSGRINLELLQRRMASLEDENKSLKTEYLRLEQDTESVEEQEQLLLKDLTGQLTCANSSMTYLEDELERQKDENRIQHEQIFALQSKLDDTEVRLNRYTNENEQLAALLNITKENQSSLAVELSEFKARYYEIETLLHDAQEQLRKLRRKQLPGARINFFTNHMSTVGSNSLTTGYDSLQNELEMSLYASDFGGSDSGISNPGGDSIPHYKRVFDTVRCASISSGSTSDSSGVNMPIRMSTVCQSTTSSHHQLSSCNSSIYSYSSLGYPSLDSSSFGAGGLSSDTDSSDEGYPAVPQCGVPGAPGAADLEVALKRLSATEIAARRTNLYRAATDGPLMATGWRLPEKLQIVKPLEGSQTLQQWSQLAQPTFGGLLEERPGVKVRGGKELDEMGLEQYALCDLEEDGEMAAPLPGKMFDSGRMTYTYTNSMVLHPDDGTSCCGTTPSSRVPSICSSINNSPPSTAPLSRPLSRRNSCSTFSTTYGLASLLNERGIKAATPSKINSPNTFTPTATPYNSPDSTRPPSPTDDPFALPKLLLPQFLLDTVIYHSKGTTKSNVCKKRSPKPKPSLLMGKIEEIGVSNLMGAPPKSAVKGHDLLTDETDSVLLATPTRLGVPGTPGTETLNKRLKQLNARQMQRKSGGTTRSDLGTVRNIRTSDESMTTPMPPSSGTLGTLSSLLFGRKGGLF